MEAQPLLASNVTQDVALPIHTVMNLSTHGKSDNINSTLILIKTISEDTVFRFPTIYLCCLIFISTIGGSSNLFAAKYTKDSFTLSKSIYMVLFFDSLVTSLGFIVIQGITIFLIMKPNLAYGQISCSALYIAAYVPTSLGPFFVSQISILRWIIVRTKIKECIEQEKTRKKIVVTLLILGLMYHAICFSIGIKHGSPLGILQQVCLYGDKCDDMISGSTQHSTISPVPYLLANLCPPVMDVMTSIHLKKRTDFQKFKMNGQSENQSSRLMKTIEEGSIVDDDSITAYPKLSKLPKKDILEIPLRATVISSISAASYLVLMVIFFTRSMSMIQRSYILTPLSMLLNVIRVPIIVLTTFKKNQTNMAITKSAKKTLGQRKEIYYALEEREERRKNMKESGMID